ncbi:hypothetical protein [Fox circovirus]|uniref:Uncharacterized protein n=1 Tax=Fox circovirus TaxID=1678251 RepID=A0A0H4KBJ4_9CIRC|nr:hypothetical protein [Fox circovirus]
MSYWTWGIGDVEVSGVVDLISFICLRDILRPFHTMLAPCITETQGWPLVSHGAVAEGLDTSCVNIGFGVSPLLNPEAMLKLLDEALSCRGSYMKGALFGSFGGSVVPGTAPGSRCDLVAFPLP